MRFANVETPWTKFAKAQDFAFVGRDALATVSGVHARFYDLKTGETRIERFEGRERGDGACCVAGLSVAPIFSLVERKSNPRITIFAYPSMRKVARCANSQEANGYACCAFAGTEYLLGQTIFPDFRTILWQWRTGEQLTTTDPATITLNPAGDLRATFSCSPDSPLLVARKLATKDSALMVFRVLSCSKIVRLFPIEISGISNREPSVSLSWTSEGTLLLCDRLGNVEAIEIDEDEARSVGTVVPSVGQPSRNPVLVAHRDGAMLVVASPVGGSNRLDVRATFFRRRTNATDRNEHWRPIWTISLPSYPNRAESHSSDDRIVLFGEGGEMLSIVGGSRDRSPRLDILSRDDDVGEVAAIAPLRGLSQYFAALSNHPKCRLSVLDATTGMVVSPRNRSPLLNHHGEVTRLASHSSSPILATCSVDGNCLVLDVSTPSAPKIARCAHLQKDPLDRLKFSEEGALLGVGSSRLGRVFVLEATTAGEVVAAFNVGRQMVDFLIYRTNSRVEAKVLVLVAANETRPLAGGAIAVFSCQLNGEFRETATADRAITVPFLYESVYGIGRSHPGGASSGEAVLAIPYLSKQLHRIEFESDFQEATLTEVVPSLHRTRNHGIGLHRGRSRDRAILLACGYDGSIVARDDARTLRAFAVFVAHHRSEGGTRSAVLVAATIVSLGRNGDLAANRIFEANGKRVRDLGDRPDSPRGRNSGPESESESESKATTQEEEHASETWMERSIRKRIAVEEREALSTRLSILDDLNGLRTRFFDFETKFTTLSYCGTQMKALLDSNESETPEARLPISAFDLDAVARECKLAAARSTGERVSQSIELKIERYDRASRYLRERFVEPLRVPPSCVSSVLGKSKVTNYPLAEMSSQDSDLLAWCRFSEETRQAVSKLEAEYDSEPFNEENQPNQPNLFDSRHGYLQVREASILANDSERAAKIRFNELYEEIRTDKRRETKAAIERTEETRRCVVKLMETFGVDTSERLPNASLWYNTEETSSLDGDRVEPRLEAENTGNSENSETGEENDCAFRRSALERMMDGVLEVGLEENAKRIVPMPDCLVNEIDPSGYTKEDVEAIEAYENKLSALRADRLAYRSTLEENIDRANDEFWSRARAFDDRLNELAVEKIRVERSVLLDRLTASWRILWHRRIGQRRREIRYAIEHELSPAAKRVRTLAAESELFEAGLIELRNRYEVTRRRDKLLEEKFRTDFLDSKQPMAAEQLLRHYRKRPRTALAAACGTSVAFLRELAERVLDATANESELLPREWMAYLRGLRDLDATPDGGLPSRVEADQWREACALRRLKIEAEIKVRGCAIELAEAEQSLAFHRRACSNARAAVARRKENVLRLEKAMLELLEDQEVRLVLKTGQLREQPRGCSASEWAEAVLIPRRELDDVAEAVAAASQRKLAELRRVVNLQRARSQEQWRRACLQLTMEDLRASLLDLTIVKARKLDGRGFVCAKNLSELAECSSTKLSIRELEDTVREERRSSQRISDEAGSWRRRNSKLKHRIQKTEAETDRMAAAITRDPLRVKTAGFRERKMRAIARKASLARAVRSNFEELTTLENHLEISKLRTYPTLRLKM
ncbi:cilia- and flagella-associated protein 43 [Lasioglossum baleicum]|uniref:cilia- and flagella-associated protein 43 n=1 Tax=Lasioglossum baleicum TaxID=434251 RepID=UPI003FCC6EAD